MPRTESNSNNRGSKRGAVVPSTSSSSASISNRDRDSKRDSGRSASASASASAARQLPPTTSTRSAHTLLLGGAATANANANATSNAEEDHPDLLELEERLNHEVDEEFFQDPRKFHTLHRVIDVLGMQLDSKEGWMGNNNNTNSNTNNTTATTHRDLESNPAYKVLKQQQQVVEEAIEYLALIHCADLNGSVVQVGRVARQFNDAVSQVRQLRKQVKEIQETLGAGGAGQDPASSLVVVPPNQTTTTTARGSSQQQQQQQQQLLLQQQQQQQQAAVAASSAQAAVSLREMWLKKLEAEAVLSLLEKLDRIRAAPFQFDSLLKQHRIGAAVLTVSQALDTMFSSDVAQVQALHKIMEQLLLRKQKAEEVVWELLMDVIFLRTGNGATENMVSRMIRMQKANATNAAANSNSNSRPAILSKRGGSLATANNNNNANSNSNTNTNSNNTNSNNTNNTNTNESDQEYPNPYGIVNPFLSPTMRYAVHSDLQVEQQQPGALSLALQSISMAAFIEEDYWQEDDAIVKESMMIPMIIMEAEFDLESEEKRHLEERQQQDAADDDDNDDGNAATGNGTTTTGTSNANAKKRNNRKKHNKKRAHNYYYGDYVLALRTLVECLMRLRRLDDVERILTEGMAKEVEGLVQREQARTFLRVEGSTKGTMGGIGGAAGGGRYAMWLSKAGATTDLRDFRAHLHSVVSAFGNVQLRLAHLAQIVRHRLKTERAANSTGFSVSSAALSSTIKTAQEVMERELKSFLNACLLESIENKEPEFNINALTNVSGQSRQVAAKTKTKRRVVNGLETGLFSLGILDSQSMADSAASTAEAWLTASTTSRRSTIQSLATPKFVQEVLFSKTTHNGTPQVRHALFFRKAIAKWHQDIMTMRSQLTNATMEDPSSAPGYRSTEETPALEFLDTVIQRDLLPVLQEEAVNGTVQALERPDAFDPVLDRNVYARADSNEPQDVDMCRACNALYSFTGPLFLALHRLPKGGEMYLPLVAVLEHVILTFISRVKQQVSKLCSGKTALQLVMDSTADGASFAAFMERRKAFAQLVLAYADGDLLEAAAVSEDADATAVPLLSPSTSDTPNKSGPNSHLNKMAALSGMEDLDFVGGVEREEVNLSNELQFVRPFLEFAGMEHNTTINICSDEHLMKSACLAHSLLKLSSLLDSRLKVRSALVGGLSTKTLNNTRALREAIKTIKANGLKMAKFCRADVLLQAVTRLAKVCNSSTVVARDAVRIPSSVNDLGEYMTAASDNLREAAGNAVTAYTFSTLEQYIPLCLIQTVRVLAAGKGIVTKAPLTMNGIEALDRSGSVLYRDLKGATSFDNSFWDIELAAVSFERSASFIAMMELEMSELEAYYQENRNDFSEQDFQLMFSMNGPRRKGDIGRYHMLVKRLDKK